MAEFKLSEINILMESVYEDLGKLSSVQSTKTGFTLIGLQKAKEGIAVLEELGLFSDLVNTLKNAEIYTTLDDILDEVGKDETNKTLRIVSNLKLLIEAFNITLTKVLPEENVLSVNIKLPPVNDLGELSKVTRDLHNAISQVIINDEINGQEKIESVENGSIWLNIFLGTTTAVSVIAALAWAGAVVYKKINEGRMTSEGLRGMKLKNDALVEVNRVLKSSVDNAIQAEAEFIASEHFQDAAPENIERIKNSISTFADLISKGAEVHPALMAPEQVSNLFPDPTKLIGLESKIKRIEG